MYDGLVAGGLLEGEKEARPHRSLQAPMKEVLSPGHWGASE